MSKFVIALGHAPHLKLTSDGTAFSSADAPMLFVRYDDAYQFLISNGQNEPLADIRADIVEDLSSEETDNAG